MGKRVGPNAKKRAAQRWAKIIKIFNVFIVALAVVLSGAFVYSAIFPTVVKKASEKIVPYIAINAHEIRGGDELDLERIEDLLNLDENSNLFNVRTKEIADEIAKIDGVESVKVSKKPFSQALEIRITQRTPKYLLNFENELYWADRFGYLWQNDKINLVNDVCLVVGLEIIRDESGTRISESDLARLEKTFSSINGTDAKGNNIKSIHFRDYGVVEFTANSVSVPVRLNGTLRYATDDFVKFENILRQNKRTPVQYLDAYENVVYAK